MMKSISLENLLLFTLGFSSTLQLLTIKGINAFTWFLLVFLVIELIGKRKPKYDKRVSFFSVTILLSLLNCALLSKYWTSNIDAWKVNCLKSVVVYFVLFISYGFIVNKKEKKISCFFHGFYYSCCFQLVWCYLQFLFRVVMNIDLNNLIFAENDQISAMNVLGQHVLTGLNLNGGIMVPILLYLLYVSKNRMIMVASFLLFFLSGSSTMCVIGIIVVAFEVIRTGIYKKISAIKLSLALSITLFSVVIIAIMPGVFERINDIVSTLFIRLGSIRTQSFIEGSTYVHFRYYSSLPHILSNIDIGKILFGFGFKNGGLPFVKFYNQYPDLVYGTESDPISLLYGVGIIGLFAFYSIIYQIIKRSKSYCSDYSWFEITLIVAGVFYGVHMNWLLLIQFCLLEATKRKMNMKELFVK